MEWRWNKILFTNIYKRYEVLILVLMEWRWNFNFNLYSLI